MRRAAIALAIVGLLVAAVPALAQTNDIEIFLGGTIKAPAGSLHEVYNEPVPQDLVGRTCTGSASTENNASEHPNNDLIITSGTSSAEVLDYEAVAGGTTLLTGSLTLGERLVLTIRLGPNGVTSGGLTLVLNCQPEPTTTTTEPPPTTTTTAPPPTTTTPTTAPPGTTTTEAPPTGGVAAGGGGTAGANPAAPWIGGGALLLAAALGAAALGRQLMTRRD